MEIIKIAQLSDEEKQAIIKAGEIIGSFNRALKDGSVNLLNDETTSVLQALSKVVKEVLDNKE